MKNQRQLLIILSVVLGLCINPFIIEIAAQTKSELDKSLFDAVERGDLKMVNNIISKGANVNAKDKDGNLPIVLAAYGNVEIEYYSIYTKTGGDGPNINRRTPIYKYNGSKTEIVKTLITNGANVNAKNAKNETALMGAILNNGSGLVKYLLDNGVSVKDDNGENSAIKLAARSKYNYFIVKELLAHGADPNEALETSINNNTHEILELLIANGAVLVKSKKYLVSSIDYDYVNLYDIFRVLIENGAEVNVKDYSGDTPLMKLVDRGGHIESMKLLIEKGIDINAKNNYGRTALMLASIDKRTKTAEFLIANGADLNAIDIHGFTALELVKQDRYGYIREMVKVLKKAKHKR